MVWYRDVAIIGTVRDVVYSGRKWNTDGSLMGSKPYRNLIYYSSLPLLAGAEVCLWKRLKLVTWNGQIVLSRRLGQDAKGKERIGIMFRLRNAKKGLILTAIYLQPSTLGIHTKVALRSGRFPAVRFALHSNLLYVRSGCSGQSHWLDWAINTTSRLSKPRRRLPAMLRNICSNQPCSRWHGRKAGNGFVTHNRSLNYRTKRPTLLFFFHKLTGQNWHLSQRLSILTARKLRTNVYIAWRVMTY